MLQEVCVKLGAASTTELTVPAGLTSVIAAAAGGDSRSRQKLASRAWVTSPPASSRSGAASIFASAVVGPSVLRDD